MSDAPERIWADMQIEYVGNRNNCHNRWDDAGPRELFHEEWGMEPTEYIRADLARAPAWQDISTAPRDGKWILAQLGQITDGRYDHWSGRCFVVRHGGYTSGGIDMGWQLFPGFACGDEWLARWMPAPQQEARDE